VPINSFASGKKTAGELPQMHPPGNFLNNGYKDLALVHQSVVCEEY
jgi:hypothetical protein